VGRLAGLFETAGRTDLPADEEQAVGREILASLRDQIAHGVAVVDPDEIRDSWERFQHQSLAKSVVLSPSLYAATYPGKYADDPRRARHHAVLHVHELGVIGQTADPFAEKPTVTSGFEFLRMMASRVDIIQAMIQTRVHQVVPFARFYREDDNNPLGVRFVRNDGERLTKADQKEIARLEALIESSGATTDPLERRWNQRLRTFPGFVAAMIADTLTADACPIETVRARSGKLLGWHNLDFTTIRLAFEDGYEGNDAIVGVQIDPLTRQPFVGFERDELIYEVRNPRSSIYLGGYGDAELEHFVRAATAYLNLFAMNSTFVDKKAIPRGFFTLFGDYNQRQVLDLQQKWQLLLSGASNQWNIPIMVARSKTEGGAAWTPIDNMAEAEMFMVRFLTFLVSLGCAFFGLAPEELNFESFSVHTSSLSGKDTTEKLQSSRDRGLIPLMLFWIGLVNDNLVSQLTTKYRLTPVGLFPEDEARKHERQKLTLTVDRMLTIDGEAKHEDPLIGGAPVNPALQSLYITSLQQQGKLAPPEQPGGEGAPPGRIGDGLPASEAPLPYARDAGAPATNRGSDAARGRGGTSAARPTGGRLQKAEADPPLVVQIRHLPDEAWP